jgi:hypothetical protein
MSGKQPSLAASRATTSSRTCEAMRWWGELAVAGVGAGAAASFLLVGLFGGLGDVEADPAGGADVVERGSGGGLDRDDGLDAGLG